MDQGIVSGLYDFPAREYNPLEGRWPSPDPAGIDSANPTDPQTLNLYSYVRDNPLSMVDPTGLIGGCPTGEVSNGVSCVPGAPSTTVTVTDDTCDMLCQLWLNLYGQFGISLMTPQISLSLPSPYAGLGGGGTGGPYGPQSPTPEQPQKKPCTAASRAASTVEALDAAGDALVSFNLAAVHFGAAVVLFSGGCLEPTPAEPLTCAASVFGVASLSAGGAALTGFGAFQTKRAFSAAKQAFTCGPGS